MTYCSRTRPGVDGDAGQGGRAFDVCREHHPRLRSRGRRYRAPEARAVPGILADDATKRTPRPRRWPSLRLPIRKPTQPTAAAEPSNGTPSPGSVVARSESVRSARTAVAALASLAVHRPASQRKDGRP